MLLSALSKFLASLLAVTLVGAVLMLVLNQTLLNSRYIEGKLTATNSYAQLSVGITDQISKHATEDAQGTENQQVKTVLATILTPQVLQTKINSALDGLQAYYRGNGQPPVIDLTDVAAQAQAAGVPIPEDSGITKPIPLGTSKRAKDYGRIFDNIRLSTIISMLVLATALVVLCWRRQKWTPLPNVLIATGVLLGLFAVLLAATSGLVAHTVKFDTNANAFAVLGRDLASAITKDLASRLGVIAAVFGVVGIAARIWVGRITANKPTTPVGKQSPVLATKSSPRQPKLIS